MAVSIHDPIQEAVLQLAQQIQESYVGGCLAG